VNSKFTSGENTDESDWCQGPGIKFIVRQEGVDGVEVWECKCVGRREKERGGVRECGGLIPSPGGRGT